MFLEKEMEGKPIIKYKKFMIDPQRRVFMIEGKEALLFPKEFDLLYFFATHPERVLSKAQIYEEVYREEAVTKIDNIIYCLIHGLRTKIEKDLRYPKYIITMRGVGYKFVIPE